MLKYSNFPQPESTIESTDPDLRLLLSSAEPLLMSRNPSVGILFLHDVRMLKSFKGDIGGSTSILLHWTTF